MGKACIAFNMEDVAAALAHIHRSFEMQIDYGDRAYGHCLQPWDEGGRCLFWCKACGGYLLRQESEFHSFCGDDSYYVDYYPVSGPEEADQLNRMYDGGTLELCFSKRYLSSTNGRWRWRKGFKQHD